MKLLVAFAFALALSACQGCNHNPPPTPAPLTVDGGGPCAAVCARGLQLGCAWATATPLGYTCEAVCENANDPAGPIRWDFACRINASSCDAEARCQ